MRKLRNTIIAGVCALSVAACIAACTTVQKAQVQADLATPAGQLFCAIQGPTGTIVAGLINAGATQAGLGPVAVIATGAVKMQVDADCAAAGGVAVSPPTNPAAAPQVAVVVPVVPAAPVATVPAVPAVTSTK